MEAWPEITHAKLENRRELILSGSAVSSKLEKHGISDELFSCTGLNFLRISETCLIEIPPKIKMLHNLTSLVVHTNKLTGICSEIGELKKLKLLDASNNQIQEIPGAIANLESLTTLNLSSNKIKKIPDMSNNKWLSTVDLSFNALDDMSELCKSQLIHLAEIHLKGNKILDIPVTIKELHALKLLDLSDNGICQIPGEVGDVLKLKEINLQGNPLADKRLSKVVVECKSKQVLDYIREHCARSDSDDISYKGKKGKKNRGKQLKERVKQSSCNEENSETSASYKHKIIISKPGDICKITRTNYVLEVYPHILAVVLKDVNLNVDVLKKFIQLQSKLHDGICDKRNFATIATHDLDSCKGRKFTFTALSPEGLKILPLTRSKEFSGKELLLQLQTEADVLRKEKKRNTYSGIHKFLYLLEGKPLYPCLLNAENTVISFPPLTNSELTKITADTKNILIEVTSSSAQGNCKKVLDFLLKEMLLNGIGVTTDDSYNNSLTLEQVRIEGPDENLIAVYPSKVDLVFESTAVEVIRE